MTYRTTAWIVCSLFTAACGPSMQTDAGDGSSPRDGAHDGDATAMPSDGASDTSDDTGAHDADAMDATDVAVPDAGDDARADAAVDGASDAGNDAATGPFTGVSLGLDESGRTVPDTNYAIPSGAIFIAPTGDDANAGTQASPVRTINRAVALVPSGGTIVARGGVYRDWYNNAGTTRINTRLFTLQSYPHEQVWFDGSDIVPTANWHADTSGHWYVAWDTPTFCNGHYYDVAPNAQNADNSGPCTHRDMYDAAHPVAGDPQNVFVDGARLEQVGTLAEADATHFFYDWTMRRLYIGRDPSGHMVELSARPAFMVSGVSAGGMVFRGIGLRRYATNEYSNITVGAIYIGGGGNNTIENCVFTQMSGQALAFSNPSGARVAHSVFAFNGFNGVGANGHSSSGARDDLTVQDSVFNAQNLEHYGTSCTISCASAHIKFAHLVGWTVRNSVFENGDAVTTGVWCDTDCSEGVTVGNYLAGGANAPGIHYEINRSGIIAGNLVIGFSSGINVGSQNVQVYNNTLVDQRVISLRAYDDSRAQATTNLGFGNNVSVGTNVNKVWFSGQGGQNNPDTFITSFDFNAFYRPTNFVLYRWIGTNDTSYHSSTEFHAAHTMFEANSIDVIGASSSPFVDASAGDYRIAPGSMPSRSGGLIPAAVAAAMGVPATAGQDRGVTTWPRP